MALPLSVAERVEKIKSLISLLELLPSLEDSRRLSIRVCPSSLLCESSQIPDCSSHLRSRGSNLPVCQQFDSVIFNAFSNLIGGSVTSWARLKASLPIRLGGLGLRQAGVHCAAIFISSVHACSPLIYALSGQSVSSSYISSALQVFCSGLGWAPLSSLEDFEIPISQKSLSRLIDNSLFKGLLGTALDPRHRALALSSSLPHAGDWLTALPSPNLGLHFLSPEFRVSLCYWLGVPLSASGQDCSICLRPADPFGDHAVACGGNGDRIYRHNNLRDIIFTAAQSAALSPRREVPSLVPDSSSRPADIFVPSWSLGRPAAMGVSTSFPQRLSVSLWRANAQMWLSRFPPLPPVLDGRV